MAVPHTRSRLLERARAQPDSRYSTRGVELIDMPLVGFRRLPCSRSGERAGRRLLWTSIYGPGGAGTAWPFQIRFSQTIRAALPAPDLRTHVIALRFEVVLLERIPIAPARFSANQFTRT